jgi:CYTH domain-containing protein
MCIEIEKKFIIEHIPFPLDNFRNVKITQGYVAVEEGYAEVRIRHIEDKYVLTVKSDRSNYRFENECVLDTSNGVKLLCFCKNRIVKKTRYYIPYNNVQIELDIFEGKLEGLVVAEVEFKSFDDIKNFITPSWFGLDVTDDKRYKNKNLAIYGL